MGIDMYKKKEDIQKENNRIRNQKQPLIDSIPVCATQTEWDVRECFFCCNFRGIRVYSPSEENGPSEGAISKFSKKNYSGVCAWVVCAVDSL